MKSAHISDSDATKVGRAVLEALLSGFPIDIRAKDGRVWIRESIVPEPAHAGMDGCEHDGPAAGVLCANINEELDLISGLVDTLTPHNR